MPPLVCSADRKLRFEPVPGAKNLPRSGTLRIPLSARLCILDGLHRRAGLEAAMRANPALADEAVSLIILIDPGLEFSEQAVSDLRRGASGSSRADALLCDQRDDLARLTREMVERVDVFAGMTETARSTISNRSLKLFTLSGMYHANRTLLAGRRDDPHERRLNLTVTYWNEVASHIPAWRHAKARKISPAELRRNLIHAHALALAALARVGRYLFEYHPTDWKARLRALETLDWSRFNTRQWEGRAMIAGRVSKSSVSILLTANVIKRHLQIPLTAEEQESEKRRRSAGE
jgi:DNA sulfur modification protein DndB